MKGALQEAPVHRSHRHHEAEIRPLGLRVQEVGAGQEEGGEAPTRFKGGVGAGLGEKPGSRRVWRRLGAGSS